MDHVDVSLLLERAVGLTQELIRLPSESSVAIASDGACPEREVAAHLVAFCRQYGLDASLQEALPGRENVLVRVPRDDAPKVLLAAHMDTVSAKGMTEPFSGICRDGRIWGRGACDDKGPLACVFATVTALSAAGETLFCDLTLAATVDEECSLAGAAALAEEDGGAYDLIIAFEPTGGRIVHAHKGDYRIRLTTRGRAVHSSVPEEGENAIDKMMAVLSDIEKMTEEFQHVPATDLGRPTVAVTTISGGSSGNIIPEYCEATVDIRLLPEMDAEKIALDVAVLVGDRASIQVLFSGPGIRTDVDVATIRRLQETIVRHGGDPLPVIAAYATDCSRLQKRGPCIVWGPGDIGLAHHVKESISLGELRNGCQVLADFLRLSPK